MAIIRDHFFFHEEILSIPELICDPVLSFGFTDCLIFPPRPQLAVLKRKIQIAGLQWFARKKVGGIQFHETHKTPECLDFANLSEVLENLGAKDVTTLDFFDDRADLRHDMNFPLPDIDNLRFNTVIDIGSTEHVFDTRQCIENLITVTNVGGHLVLSWPCHGLQSHGFHTFNPELVQAVLSVNGFSIIYQKFSTMDGIEVEDSESIPDCLIWIVAKRLDRPDDFKIPQQGEWAELYQQKNK